ncbi:MAG TPA: sigma 54-interacting transcriptional regulator, partial [Anaeromyxobacteraceae bacterium]|nr:sigma 54-interacting transcriptional regulator [Anaeromyxobacteraceae bacterium]
MRESHEAFEAVAAAFGSLGRVCLALDSQFAIRRLSPKLDDLLGPGAARRYEGRAAEELLGSELFGSAGTIRDALASGERREAWRAWLRTEPEGARLVSLSAAPFLDASACDPEVAYLVVLGPADGEEIAGAGVPTSFAGVIARSRSMMEVLRLVERLQHSDVSVLVTGESGVGKGVIAQAIHANSLRRDGPLVTVNCAAL